MTKPFSSEIKDGKIVARPANLEAGDLCFQCKKDKLIPARNDMLFCVTCNEHFDIWDGPSN